MPQQTSTNQTLPLNGLNLTAPSLAALDQELNRSLSLHGAISMTNSWTFEDIATVQTVRDSASGNYRQFRKIGGGTCGVVFSPGPYKARNLAFKLSLTMDDRPLWNDYKMHTLIEHNFLRRPVPDVCIPECHSFFREREQLINENPGLIRAAEMECNLPTSVLVTERILPLPKRARNLIIQKYCSPQAQDLALKDPANGDCLVRIYLGSNCSKSSDQYFSLRNFKLSLNQMLELKMDVQRLARAVGRSLAVLHWAAQTDARDVEFVLGTSRKKIPRMPLEEVMRHQDAVMTLPHGGVRFEDLDRYTTKIWILDFNQVKRITMDATGVEQAIEAALKNDPYMPRPPPPPPLFRDPLDAIPDPATDMETQVWEAFEAAYLQAADRILRDQEGFRLLPRMFISRWKEVLRRREELQNVYIF